MFRDRQEDKESLVKGPPASRGFDAAGQPTRAAEGFAQSKGISVHDLETREIDGGTYLVALVKEVSRPAIEVLKEALAALVAGIKFDKTMRWNYTNVPFSRPVRWLLAMLGGNPIPFEFAGLTAGNTTHGLRFLEPGEKAVSSVEEYMEFLESQGSSLTLRAQSNDQSPGQSALPRDWRKEGIDEGLLDEVNQLVEAPTALRGKFDPVSSRSAPRSIGLGDEETSTLLPGAVTGGKSDAIFHRGTQR